ncbi:MAG: acyl-ACP desaturase, partial [Planctomycetes bacterium]|nr:acyl-ACP desaturase [Planctomycetota bacterium]
VAEEWFPHEYVPYSQGRDFDTEPWTPDHSRLTGVAQIAFEVNLLTEDNLPSYHREIDRMFGRRDSAWTTWVHRWTAEEGRHAIVMRDYLTVTRGVDPVGLERARMRTVEAGYDGQDRDALHGMAYVSFQELATRISHRNTGRHSDDPVADRIMARIAADENLHMVFYRDAISAALTLAPSATVTAIADEVIGFEMPGSVIAGFGPKAAQIADAGIYDLRGHHDDVVTEYPYTMLVATADACSASRPGARRESLDRYIKRMEELEAIAGDFDGVHQAFAIQAGRELRVIVGSEKTDDASAAKICRDIANAFEQQLTYPGEIKVTVVRESRFVEMAR